MATAYKPRTREDVSDRELETRLNGFVKRVHLTLEDARGNMSDEEAEEADRKAKAILDRASTAARSSRHSA